MFRLRTLRKERKISMRELGSIIGVHESTISLYETGKRQPDYDTLNRLADYFQVSVDYLLGRSDVPNETKAPIPQDEISPNSDNSARLLSEIMNLAKELSEIEQDYILDMIRTFQSHRETLIEQKTK